MNKLRKYKELRQLLPRNRWKMTNILIHTYKIYIYRYNYHIFYTSKFSFHLNHTNNQCLLEILKHDLVIGSPLYMKKHLGLREELVKGKSVLMPKILENSFKAGHE